MHIYISCLIVIDGDPTGSFSTDITPRSSVRCYSLSLFAQFTLDLYSIMLNIKQRGIKFLFL